MGIGDFFSAEAGQARRKWLDEQANSLMYYVPPEIRPWVYMADQALPTTQFGNTISASQDMLDPSLPSGERWRAGGDMAAGVLGTVAPMAIASKAGAPMANAVMEGLMNYSGPTRNALADFATDESGAIRLWHGSPHDFDRFDMSKIGTGEGAQAYGHGLYFAENEAVAKGYKNALSDTVVVPDGTPNLEKRAAQMALTFGDNTSEGAIAWLGKFKNGANHTSPAMTPELVEAVSKKFASGEFKPGGFMYEVNVNADPADFLDWDKPLSEQPQKVREWAADVANTGGLRAKKLAGYSTGRDVWEASRSPFVSKALGFENYSTSGPSDAMKGRGIPGIRYLDQGSRGAGDGSRNYVLFDDSLITILKKYGLLPASMMGAAVMQPGQAQAGPAAPPRPQQNTNGSWGW